MDNIKDGNMPLIDFILINIPVWLFFIFSLISLISAFFIKGIPKYLLFGFSWWCLCGGILVFTDYKRKKRMYLKILKQGKTKDRIKRLTDNLKDTICNCTLSLAINHRARNLMN